MIYEVLFWILSNVLISIFKHGNRAGQRSDQSFLILLYNLCTYTYMCKENADPFASKYHGDFIFSWFSSITFIIWFSPSIESLLYHNIGLVLKWNLFFLNFTEFGWVSMLRILIQSKWKFQTSLYFYLTIFAIDVS